MAEREQENTKADPLAALIAEYRRQVECFNARAKTENWDSLLADTYGPPSDKLRYDPPEPTSLAGIKAAISLAVEEPDLYAIQPVMVACSRYLERECK